MPTLRCGARTYVNARDLDSIHTRMQDTDCTSSSYACQYKARGKRHCASSRPEARFAFVVAMCLLHRQGRKRSQQYDARIRVSLRSIIDGYRSTRHLLQSPMLGLDGIVSADSATGMWVLLIHACIDVRTKRIFLPSLRMLRVHV